MSSGPAAYVQAFLGRSVADSIPWGIWDNGSMKPSR